MKNIKSIYKTVKNDYKNLEPTGEDHELYKNLMEQLAYKYDATSLTLMPSYLEEDIFVYTFKIPGKYNSEEYQNMWSNIIKETENYLKPMNKEHLLKKYTINIEGSEFMKFILNLYSDDYVNNNKPPNNPEDIKYRNKLIKLAEKMGIKTLILQPDYDEDYEYIYYFKLPQMDKISEIAETHDTLNRKMFEYSEKLGIKDKRYAIIPTFDY